MDMRKLFVAAAAAAALAGCGGGSDGPSADKSTAPTPTPSGPSGIVAGTPSPDPRTPAPKPPGVSVTPLPTTTATATSARSLVVSLPWSYLETTDGGRAVEIKTVISGCTRFSGVQAIQQTGSVEIAVLGTRPPTSARIACPAIARILVGAVRLDQPLGHRTLLHAPLSSSP